MIRSGRPCSEGKIRDGAKLKQRRALSSIVGLSFMIILVSTGLSAIIWAVQQQQQVITETAEKSNEYLNRLSESVAISQVKINNNKLNLTLYNEGGSAAQVKAIYIVNETAVPKQQYRYDVDYLVDGRAVVNNVGQSLAFVAKNTSSYSIKVVTKTGTTALSTYIPVSLTAIHLSLSVVPPTITSGENMTLLYTIANNLTSVQPLTVYPTINKTVTCAAGQTCTAIKVTSAPNKVVIEKGMFVIVKETYRVEGPPGTKVTFNASFVGAKSGNYVTEKGTVIAVLSSLGLSTGIATKPDMFLILPSPFGDSPQQGLWGAVVVNPTNSNMTVSRVLITVFTAAHSGDTVIATNCPRTPIFPNVVGEWSCPHNHQIQWKNVAAPQLLQPGETKSFMIRVRPDNLNISEEPGATVVATVYTNVGIFTKTGYTIGMRDTNGPLGNVYLTDTTDTSAATGALNNAHMLGHMNNLPPGTNRTFYVAMAELDSDSGTRINSGAKLIINVPPGFTNVNDLSWSGFVNNPTITVRADGITQIIATTNEHVGNVAGGEAKVLSFSAITPSPLIDTTYIMFAFIDGLTNGNPQVSAGAIAEISLQVNVP